MISAVPHQKDTCDIDKIIDLSDNIVNPVGKIQQLQILFV